MFRRATWSLNLNSVAILAIMSLVPLLLFLDRSLALLIYGCLFAAVATLAWRNHVHLRNFKMSAEVVTGAASGVPTNSFLIAPELAPVLDRLQALAQAQRGFAANLRIMAQANHHAEIGLIAIIRSAVEPLRRLVAEQNIQGQRSLSLIDASITRLVRLVVRIHRDIDQVSDFVGAPREQVSLAALINRTMLEGRETASDRGVSFTGHIAGSDKIQAPDGMVQAVLNNVFDAASILAAEDSSIAVTLSKSNQRVDLFLEADRLASRSPLNDGIFDREYFSNLTTDHLDTAEDADFTDDSPSLWNARRNLEFLGGGILSEPRVGEGFSLHMWFPQNDQAHPTTA